MKNSAIQQALAQIGPDAGIGVSQTHVAVNFNQTDGNHNSLLVLRREDAEHLLKLLIWAVGCNFVIDSGGTDGPVALDTIGIYDKAAV